LLGKKKAEGALVSSNPARGGKSLLPELGGRKAKGEASKGV
jgi:hypothetical protein